MKTLSELSSNAVDSLLARHNAGTLVRGYGDVHHAFKQGCFDLTISENDGERAWDAVLTEFRSVSSRMMLHA